MVRGKNMRKSLVKIMVILLLTLSAGSRVDADDIYPFPDNVTEIYELYFGPMVEAFPGELELYVPIHINVTVPTVGVNLLLGYDPSLLTPTVVAPNMFFQNFDTDLSMTGRIGINLYTNLPPPPVIPPIDGDTIFAWISFRVTTEDLGYDLLTHITYYENPVTPYPDNTILLENGGWIVPPTLSLVQGDVLIVSPLYGDINVNGFAYEIGDAITFFSYFMGQIEFTRRQYANSDCNRDGIQASISDLVYLIGVISGDPLLGSNYNIREIESETGSNRSSSRSGINSSLDNPSSLDVKIESEDALGGAYFVFEYDRDKVEIESIFLNNSIDNLNLSWAADDGELMIALYDWNGFGSSFEKGNLFTVNYSGDVRSRECLFRIVRAEFSNSSGEVIEAEYEIGFSGRATHIKPEFTGISISGYPNPFNGAISINYELPVEGNYDLVVYDILGREVKTLITGYKSSGGGAITWNGTDNLNNNVASGMYFARLRGETVSAVVKLYMMK